MASRQFRYKTFMGDVAVVEAYSVSFEAHHVVFRDEFSGIVLAEDVRQVGRLTERDVDGTATRRLSFKDDD